MNDVEICSNACVRLGIASFADFNSDTNASNASAVIYPQVRDSLLSRHNWHFAMRLAQLSREVATPAAKWTYQYVLPSDRLGNAPKAVYRAADAYQLPFTEWEIIEDKLLSNVDALWCQYIADIDEAEMPAYFLELLIKTMMVELCIPLLGKDAVGLRQTLEVGVWGDFGEYQKAKTADSRNHPADDVKEFILVSARHGATGRRWA